MFGWEFPPHISGGLGTACYGLTKGLTSFDDIDLTFVVPRAFGDEDNPGMKMVGACNVELSERVIAMQLGKEKKRFYEFNQSVTAYTSPEQFLKNLCEQQIVISELKKCCHTGKLNFSGHYGNTLFKEISRYGVVAAEIAQKETFDIIHAHDWLTYPAGIEAKRISGKPLIVHVHATEFDRSGENYNQEVFEIERRGMDFADAVITVSDFTRDIVINKYKINPSKVVTVHNAVEPVSESNSEIVTKKKNDNHIVTFLGRVTRQKGPEYFVKAAKLVLNKMDNVVFVMAGSGDLLESMVKLVANLGIADKFLFTGFLKGDEVYKMYKMSDLYVMPSVSEPFGISPLEAIQSNVPVIISKQSGVSEVIANAIKVDYWDIDSIADAIYGTLNYSALAKHLKIKAKSEVNELSWKKTAKKIKDIYYKVA
jgi:glycosyltransferase involved in cell wall biosynthesis